MPIVDSRINVEFVELVAALLYCAQRFAVYRIAY